MDRVAVFVDAGYLLTAGSLAVSGAVVKRQDVLLDASATMALCRSIAAAVAPSAQLLRVYWYDAAVRAELTAEQRSVAREPGCRLRLGSISAAGVQKGVDTAIVRDLGTLARNRAVTDAVLLTGDEDLHTGLDEAQEWGVRVHLAAVQRDRVLAAIALQWDADSVVPITAEQLAACIRVRPSARPTADAEFLGALGAVDERRYAAAVTDDEPPAVAGVAPEADPVAADPPPAVVVESAVAARPTPAADAAVLAPLTEPAAPLDAGQADRLRSWATRGGGDRAARSTPTGRATRGGNGSPLWSSDFDSATREEVEAVAHDFVAQLDAAAVRELHATIRPWGGVPPEWDRALILQAASTLEQPVLQEQAKRLLRQALYEAVHARVAVREG